jgi:hypothetical protein
MKTARTAARVLGSGRVRRRSITVTFRYDPRDPFAVTLLIPVKRDGFVKWVLARELLNDGRLGVEGPGGDVTVSPAASPGEVVIDLLSPSGHAAVWVADEDVTQFLTATYQLVPAGTEADRINWARELPDLLEWRLG